MKIPKCNRPGCMPHYKVIGALGALEGPHVISCGQSGCLRKVSEPSQEKAVIRWIEAIKKPLPSESSRDEFDDGW